VRYGLRIDIELDGRDHLRPDRQQRDALLRQRGWCVARVPGSTLYRSDALDAVVREIADYAHRHRAAVILARSDIPLIQHALQGITPSPIPLDAFLPLQYPLALDPPAARHAASTPPPVCPPRPTRRPPVRRANPSLCPSCSGPLVQRIARKGPNAGGLFIGCSNFPRCTYTRSIEA